MFAVAILTALMVTPALAATGCKKIDAAGSYTRLVALPPIVPGGPVLKTIYQLTLNSDGSAYQNWTGSPQLMMNTGTASPMTGSWVCRDDGKIVLNLIYSNYHPVDPSIDPSLYTPDVSLDSTVRLTYLLSVTDENTLTRSSARARVYQPTADPMDPNGGTLGTLNTSPLIYNRLVASDADLLLP